MLIRGIDEPESASTALASEHLVSVGPPRFRSAHRGPSVRMRRENFKRRFFAPQGYFGVSTSRLRTRVVGVGIVFYARRGRVVLGGVRLWLLGVGRRLGHLRRLVIGTRFGLGRI